MPINVQFSPSPALIAQAGYRTGRGQRSQYLDQLALQRAQQGLAERELDERVAQNLRDIASREFMQSRDLANSEAGRALGFLSGERSQSRQLADAERARQFGFSADQTLQNQRIQQANLQQLLSQLDAERGREFQGGENQQQRDLQRELQTQDIQFRQGESAAERQFRAGESAAERALREFIQSRDIGANLATQGANLSQREIESLRDEQLRRDLQTQDIAERQRSQTAGAVIDLNRQMQGQDFSDYMLDRQQQQDLQDRLFQGGVDDYLQQQRLQQGFQTNLIDNQFANQRQAMQNAATLEAQAMRNQASMQEAQFKAAAQAASNSQQFNQSLRKMGVDRAYHMEDLFFAEQQKYAQTENMLAQGYQFTPVQQSQWDDYNTQLQNVNAQAASGKLPPHIAERAAFELLVGMNQLTPTIPPEPQFDVGQHFTQNFVPFQRDANGMPDLAAGGYLYNPQKGTFEHIEARQQQRPMAMSDQLAPFNAYADMVKAGGDPAQLQQFFASQGFNVPLLPPPPPQQSKPTPEMQFQQRAAQKFMDNLMNQRSFDGSPVYTPQDAMRITSENFPGLLPQAQTDWSWTQQLPPGQTGPLPPQAGAGMPPRAAPGGGATDYLWEQGLWPGVSPVDMTPPFTRQMPNIMSPQEQAALQDFQQRFPSQPPAPAGAQGLPRVSTPADLAKFPPGTAVQFPDGTVRPVPAS